MEPMRNQVGLGGSVDVDGDREEEEVAEAIDYKIAVAASSPTRPGVLQVRTGISETDKPGRSKTTSQDTRDRLGFPFRASQAQRDNNSVPSQEPIQPAIWNDRQASSPNAPTHFEASKPIPGYSYEPQGELLLRDSKSQGTEEFNIPNPILTPRSTTHHQDSNPLEALVADSSTSPTPNSKGVKRKSAPDLFPLSEVEFSAAKRAALDLGEDRPAGFGRRILPPSHALAPPIHMALPARKVFPIQIGDRLFRLSGASINSDGK